MKCLHNKLTHSGLLNYLSIFIKGIYLRHISLRLSFHNNNILSILRLQAYQASNAKNVNVMYKTNTLGLLRGALSIKSINQNYFWYQLSSAKV